MPRKPQVSRTLTCTLVNALCLDIEKQKPYKKQFTLSRTYKNNKLLMKALERIANDDTHKIVHIINSEVVKQTYVMTEQEFIDKSTVKEIERK